MFDARAWREAQHDPAIRRKHATTGIQIGCPPLAAGIGAFLGCFATLHLSASGVPPAIASATVTILLCASLILTGWAELVPSAFFPAAYGGSFGGMTPVAALSQSVERSGLPLGASFTMLSISCGLVFCLACAMDIRLRGGFMRGYGGRLGALAAAGSFLFVGLAPLLGVNGELFQVARVEMFESDLASVALIFVLCTTGILATLLALRHRQVASSRRDVRTLVAATVALVGLMLLQQVQPNDPCLVDAFYAGCFLGMSSPAQLRGPLQPILAAVILTALLIESCAILPGVGGSLGLVAFVTVVAMEGLKRILAVPPGAMDQEERGRAPPVGEPLAREVLGTGSLGSQSSAMPTGRHDIAGGVARGVSRSLTWRAKSAAAGLIIVSALVPCYSPPEQAAREDTGSIGDANTLVPAIRWTLEEAGPPTVSNVRSDAAIVAAPAVDLVVSTFNNGEVARDPVPDRRAQGSRDARAGDVMTTRTKRARLVVAPGEPTAARKPRNHR
ncbi:membrane hypothetical protein [Bradyrhizobium sp. STM 3843]|uniref:hypothetical protein n=1 Tax=Bradyrhizobium sp. STM 3843 TaxID=551947 RepID=UPI000240A514|nr:hypothetical protein [Bradyrhizobium sp. STM 3843]CCE06058.1 membrane hypothetical protein [Bradyrhizobium sp. STM 3843]